MSAPSLKLLTARAVKWNTIDRLSSQVLYGVTGLVLAWLLSPKDFGLVGAILIFQAFASILVDSGFSYALIQKKEPTRLDYSTVLWFNLAMSCVIYILLYICAPLIALCFDNDQRLIPLSRVMFLTFILNASSIVQVNRFVKQMNVRPVAIANVVSLTAGGIVGIVLAYSGYGPWAIVWQSIINSGVKSALLWCVSRWVPQCEFSWQSLRGFFRVGGSMMFTSTLNTIFQHIYSFIIGNRAGLAPLGYYTQSDKWSKMGIMSIMQTLTSSFLPTLSAVQDEPERFRALCSKMNRMTAYLVFPLLGGLALMAAPVFHTLFRDKWDPSIVLFQLLLVRGIFMVLTGVYNNHIIALGRSRLIMGMEVVRDSAVVIALIATAPYISLESADDMLLGIRILLYGQVIAAAVSWAITLVYACRAVGSRIVTFVLDAAPYAILTAVAAVPVIVLGRMPWHPCLVLGAQALTGAAIYVGCNLALRSRIQADVIAYITGKMKK